MHTAEGRIITNFRGIEAGDKFIVVSNSNSHNYPLNEILTFSKDGSISSNMTDACVEYTARNTLQAIDVILPYVKLEELKEALEEAELRHKINVSILKAKIDYCEENNVPTIDPISFRIYTVIRELKDKDNMEEENLKETAEKILSLIKSV